MERTEAVQLIKELMDEVGAIRRDRLLFTAWRHKCSVVLEQVFGKDSRQSESLMKVDYNFYGNLNISDDSPKIRAFFDGLEKSTNLLKGFIWEIERFGISSVELMKQDDQSSGITERTVAVNILISWSKKQSREMATVFHDWLPKVVPGFKPWMSSKDIDKGKQWFGELQGFLGEATSCIICVTSENVRSPWVYYETGAIAAKIKENVLVCPYLVGIGTSMISDGPLSQWQCTDSTKEDTLALIKSLNKALANPHDEGLLCGNFESKWLEFEQELKRILAMDAAAPAEFIESEADVLAGFKLSSEARKLLVLAAKGDGSILCVKHDGGPTLQVGTIPVNDPADRRSTMKWEAALNDLAAHRLVVGRGNKGQLFEVSDKGYEVIDALKARGEE